MRRSTLFYLILFISLFSCKRNPSDTKIIKKYDSVDSIKIDVTKGKELLYPKTVKVIENYIVITNRNDNHFFQVYDRKNLELIGQFGSKGRGPGEYLYPSILSHSTVKGRTFIVVFDEMLRKIEKINLKKAINSETYTPNSNLLPNIIGMPEKIIYNSEDTIIYTPDNGLEHARFCIYDYKTKQKKKIPFIPELKKKPSRLNFYPIYNTISYLANSNTNQLALAPAMMGQIDFFSNKGNYLFSHFYEHQKQLNFANRNELIYKHNPFVYYTELKKYKDKIYSLCTKVVSDHKFSLSDIYVFEWIEHGIKRKISTDKVCISFDIASDNGEFYFLIYHNERFYLTKRDVL